MIARAPAGGVVTYLVFDDQAALGRSLVVWNADGALHQTSLLGCYTTPFIGSNADRFLVASQGDAGREPDSGVADAGRSPFVARYRF